MKALFIRAGIFTILLPIILSLFYAKVLADQNDSRRIDVKSIKAQTNERIQVSVWIADRPVKIGEDVIVSYKIENRSPRAIYLVNENNLTVDPVGDKYVVNPFSVGANEGEYDFTFIKIGQGRSYQSKFVIPASKITSGRWFIEVGLAFVYNPKGIDHKLRSGDDPVALRTQLVLRASTLRVGQLLLDVD